MPILKSLSISHSLIRIRSLISIRVLLFHSRLLLLTRSTVLCLMFGYLISLSCAMYIILILFMTVKFL